MADVLGLVYLADVVQITCCFLVYERQAKISVRVLTPEKSASRKLAPNEVSELLNRRP